MLCPAFPSNEIKHHIPPTVRNKGIINRGEMRYRQIFVAITASIRLNHISTVINANKKAATHLPQILARLTIGFE